MMLKRRKENPSPQRKFFRSKRKAPSLQKRHRLEVGCFFLGETDSAGCVSTVVVPVAEASEEFGRVYEIRFPPLYHMSPAEIILCQYSSNGCIYQHPLTKYCYSKQTHYSSTLSARTSTTPSTPKVYRERKYSYEACSPLGRGL
jgi:hypothetical protein